MHAMQNSLSGVTSTAFDSSVPEASFATASLEGTSATTGATSAATGAGAGAVSGFDCSSSMAVAWIGALN